jgi:hypothetical protein
VPGAETPVKLSNMNVSSRLLSNIPRPSVRLSLGLCFLCALMMAGFLVMRSSYDDAAVHHRSNTAAKHSKG